MRVDRSLGGPRRGNYIRLYREDVSFPLVAIYGEVLQEEKVMGFRAGYPKIWHLGILDI